MQRRRNQASRKSESGNGNNSGKGQSQKPSPRFNSVMTSPSSDRAQYEEDQRQFHLQQQKSESTEEKPKVAKAAAVQEKAERVPAKTGRHFTNRGRNPSPAKQTRRKESAISYYVYGKSAAIEFVCDETRKQQIQTICMRAATAKESEDRGYEWDSKTSIQIPRNELLQVTAIMLGKLERAEFHHNTQYSSKSYTVEHQGGKVFVMVSEKGKPMRAVGLSPDDTYQILSLFFRQLKSNASWMTVSEIIELIDQTVVAMREFKVEGDDAEEFQEVSSEPLEFESPEPEGNTLDEEPSGKLQAAELDESPDIAEEAFEDDAYSEYNA